MSKNDDKRGSGEEGDWETRLMKAFTHPLRRRIFRRIQKPHSALSPRQLSDVLDHPLSNVSYHVRVMADAEAIVCVDTRPVRGSVEHFYEVGPKISDVAWLTAYLEGSAESDGEHAV